MKNNILKVSLIALMLAMPVVAFGQEAPDRKPPEPATLMKQMDSNKDGKLSKKEIKGPLKNDFEKVDTDEDGFITLEELKKAPKPRPRGNRPPEKE